MKGAAAFIQGYDALDGFGITLIKNHIVEEIPIKRNMIFATSPLFALNLNSFDNPLFFKVLIIYFLKEKVLEVQM